MSKKVILAIIVIVVVIGGYFIFTGHKNTTTTNTKKTTTSTKTVSTTTVNIQNFSFSPMSLTIKQGQTVTWTNHDSVAHTVTSSSFNSQDISPGGKYQFTFNTKGTFKYACTIHPYMTGTIIVQ